MKNSLPLFIVLLLLFTGCQDPDLVLPGSEGHLGQHIRLTQIDYGDRVVSLHYNRAGQLTESHLNGEPQFRYVYDAQGKVIERRALAEQPSPHDESLQYTPYRLLRWDSQGRLVAELQPRLEAWFSDSDEPAAAFNYYHDTEGRLQRRIQDHRGAPNGRNAFTYHYEGTTLTHAFFDELLYGEVLDRHDYRFDGRKSVLTTSDYFLFEGGRFHSFPYPPVGASAASGNLTELTVTADISYYEPEGTVQPTSYYRWEYGSHGFPVKMTDQQTGQTIRFAYEVTK